MIHSHSIVNRRARSPGRVRGASDDTVANTVIPPTHKAAMVAARLFGFVLAGAGTGAHAGPRNRRNKGLANSFIGLVLVTPALLKSLANEGTIGTSAW